MKIRVGAQAGREAGSPSTDGRPAGWRDEIRASGGGNRDRMRGASH